MADKLKSNFILPQIYFREMARYVRGETYFDGYTLRDKQTKLPVKLDG